MSGTDAPAPRARASYRPLPATLDLEFEHKHAKKFLRALKRGDADALQRVREHTRDEARDFTEQPFKLANAQFVIAREYGFLSWPRLVEYFQTWQRHRPDQFMGRQYFPPGSHDRRVWQLVADHREGFRHAAQQIAAFVPRFYGKRMSDVLAATVTEDEARLVVARACRHPNWDAFVSYREPSMPSPREWQQKPITIARQAIEDQDLDALQRIVREHPDVLQRAPHEALRGNLHEVAITAEWTAPNSNARSITDWLVSQGLELQEALSWMLITPPHRSTQLGAGRLPEYVTFLLSRGADPAWIAPNGLSVLEHALLTYENGAAVDVIARRITPKRAFWIAAGLGDVRAVSRYYDAHNALTDAARKHRPDMMAIIPWYIASMPEADDIDVIAEAFHVAALNERFAVMELMLRNGFPIDHTTGGEPLLAHAISRKRVPIVEFLVTHGASIIMRVGRQSGSALEWAQQLYQHDPDKDAYRRIVELCGGTIDANEETARMERNATREVPLNARTIEFLNAMRDDAARRGRGTVTVEHLLYAFTHWVPAALKDDPSQRRGEGGLFGQILARHRTDLGALERALDDHLGATAQAISPGETVLDETVEHVIERARETSRARFLDEVYLFRLFDALVADDASPVSGLLRAAGCRLTELRVEAARM